MWIETEITIDRSQNCTTLTVHILKGNHYFNCTYTVFDFGNKKQKKSKFPIKNQK